MIGEHVDFVALPLDGLTVCRDEEAGHVFDGAGGAVLAGDPLGIDDGERAGGDGHGLGGVEDFAGGVGEVDT